MKPYKMRKQATIKIDYIGSVISCNHYLGRRRDGGTYVKPEAQSWMDELGWLIKHLHIEDWGLPLDVTCSGTFKDMRSVPDLSNLSKVTLDAIENVTKVNDQNYRWHDGEIHVDGKCEPYLLITIRENDPTNISPVASSTSKKSKSQGFLGKDIHSSRRYKKSRLKIGKK